MPQLAPSVHGPGRFRARTELDSGGGALSARAPDLRVGLAVMGFAASHRAQPASACYRKLLASSLSNVRDGVDHQPPTSKNHDHPPRTRPELMVAKVLEIPPRTRPESKNSPRSRLPPRIPKILGGVVFPPRIFSILGGDHFWAVLGDSGRDPLPVQVPQTLKPRGFFAQLGPIDRVGTAQQLWGLARAKYRPTQWFPRPFSTFDTDPINHDVAL